MRVRILYHDHCFDGAASAAYFSRFFQAKYDPKAMFEYTGLAHKATQLFEDSLFDGDVNAIVDFKYSTSPRVTWWFDHHQSAFLTPEDAEHWKRERNPQKLYNPAFRSCTSFIASMTCERFGFDGSRMPELTELVKWADIVDGAQYANAEEAVELVSPAAKLTLVIENAKGSDMVQLIIGMMREKTLEQIIEEPDIRAAYVPLYERHLRSIDIIRKRAEFERRVVYFDLTDDGLEGYNKFIPYYLYPDSIYTVSVSTSSFRTKVSVGSNPWASEEPTHNLASICERYGGGGHPRVGAISFEIGALAEARRAAAEIQRELES